MATAQLLMADPESAFQVSSLLAGPEIIRSRRQPVPAAVAPAPQTEVSPWWIPVVVALVAMLVVAASVLGALAWLPDNNFSNLKPLAPGATAAAGTLSMFAAFYVAAQAIERLLEPLSNALLNKDGVVGTLAAKVDLATKAASELADAVEANPPVQAAIDAKRVAVEAALKEVAKAKNGVDIVTQARVAAFWALATAVGVLASAGLKLYFLPLVGIGPAPWWLEVLATGLIIGAGTKPLHDLVSTISDKKDAAAAGAKAAVGVAAN